MSKIVVSIASWPPRIGYVANCVKSLLDQTMPVDEINVNLSAVEFPNRMTDLPADLQLLATDTKVCINFEEGNTYVFRKEVPVVQKYWGTDTLMISCDDDIEYAPEFVATMVDRLGGHDAYNEEPGVVGYKQISKLTKFTPEFWEALTPEVIQCGISDTWHWCYLQKIKADCKWGPREAVFGELCKGVACDVEPNSKRIGGYTGERCLRADRLSREALCL